MVSVPDKAQFETGFKAWVMTIANLARQIGCRVIFCCHPEVQPYIRGVLRHERYDIRSEYRDVEEWDDFVLLANRILDDDLFIASAHAAHRCRLTRRWTSFGIPQIFLAQQPDSALSRAVWR